MSDDKSIEEIRAIVASCERRYRFSSAVGNVCGITTSDYGPVVSLISILRGTPEAAEEMARAHIETGSPDAVAGRRARIEAILAVLDGVDHEAAPELLKALGVYAKALEAQRD
jgi:hypothetical protein